MTKKIKFYSSLLLARAAYSGIKLLSKSSGTSFAGSLVLKYYPEFLTDCGKYIKKEMITVAGTNGKTTTSGIISHILENSGNSVVHNLKGANMITGVANVFALNLQPNKKFDYAVIESDEAYLPKIYEYMDFDYLVVTNLFKDQLDRYGELSTTAAYIQKAIARNNDLKLVLNADDPLVSTFNKTKYAVYYGFENVEYDCSYQHDSKAPAEQFSCVCGEALSYEKRFFAQEGHYCCSKCGYKRPKCDYKADAIIYNNRSEIKVTHEDNQYEFVVNVAGLYNAYNALAAISLALEIGVSSEDIQKALDSFKALFGRTENRVINGKDVIIQLIKNPTGASEVLTTVDLESNVLIAVNDNYADGRDISWVWDTDFEKLKDVKNTIVTSGLRANDIALRLKYAGVPDSKIMVIPSVKEAITYVLDTPSENNKVTILPSYTALMEFNKMKI